jgi:pseudouridine kinase
MKSKALLTMKSKALLTLKNMFDLISIGDTVIDTVLPLNDADLISTDNDQIMLALPYGAKVPVGNGVSMVAGNAANNAVGSARLGLKTAIYTHSGNLDDDEDDQRIRSKFKKEGVDTRYIVDVANLPSNHNIILSFKGERTILVHHQPWKFQLPDLDKTKWVYLTSMSPSYIETNIIQQIINYVERVGCKVAYQPGTFQLKQGAKKQGRLLSMVDIIVMNVQEAKHFLGHDVSDKLPVKKLLKGLFSLGPEKVIITDGKEGSYGYDGEAFWKLDVFPAKLNEMTGAGDAFATSTVAGIIHGQILPDAMRWGAANSSAVVEEIGPQKGLLSFNQLQEKLKEYKSIVAKEF